MGTWALGPFQNDGAADLLDELAEGSPSRGVTSALKALTSFPAGHYVEVDEGSAGWAAAELVALAFGRGEYAELNDAVMNVVERLKPNEKQRELALAALARLSERGSSELAELWHEGEDGQRFDSAIHRLRARLEAASAGPTERPKPKKGDVLSLSATEGGTDLIVVQIVSKGELAVFDGIFSDAAIALAAIDGGEARRVPAAVNRIFHSARVLGNAPPSKALTGEKLYAEEGNGVDDYYVVTASFGAYREADYAEAVTFDRFVRHDVEAIRAMAHGGPSAKRVRAPEEREAAMQTENAAEWSERRSTTTPGPFGDPIVIEILLDWIAELGVENMIAQFHSLSTGQQGYGRPNESSERRSYAFCGMVALWRGTWPKEDWPERFLDRLPPPPNADRMQKALVAARKLAAEVLTSDAELRLIWQGASHDGATIEELVASLRQALE